MARYDYGMRGFRETAPPMMRGAFRAQRFRAEYDERVDPRVRTPRVTERYNRDYVYGARGPRHERNFSPYAGDPRVPMVEEYAYNRPYMTIGGTRTSRGTGQVVGYDRSYSGYYPDRRY